MTVTAAMKCTGCGKIIKFPEAKVGKTAKCPSCQTMLKLVNQAAKPKPTRVAEPPKQELLPPEPVQPPATVERQTASTPATTVPEPAIPEVPVDPNVSRFSSDGQDAAMITKLLGRIQEICTATEEPLYMAVQQKPVATIAPDAIVLTNRRAIIFRQKVLGRMDFLDVPWLEIKDVHIKEKMMGAVITIQGLNGHTEDIDYLPKAQARAVYRIGQEMEEKMIEVRRQRDMEEKRAAAGQVTVNSAVASQAAPASSGGGDLVARMGQLKQMLEADLITQEEFDAKKAEIMGSL